MGARASLPERPSQSKHQLNNWETPLEKLRFLTGQVFGIIRVKGLRHKTQRITNMSKKIIIGVIILVAISILVYLYISGFFGDVGIIPGTTSNSIPPPPPLPE